MSVTSIPILTLRNKGSSINDRFIQFFRILLIVSEEFRIYNIKKETGGHCYEYNNISKLLL